MEFDGGPSISFVRHPIAYVAEHVENDLSIFRFINVLLHTFLDLLVFIAQFQRGVADQIKCFPPMGCRLPTPAICLE